MEATRSFAATLARSFASRGFDEESRAHLQRRLRLLTGAVAAVTGTLWAAFVAVGLLGGQAPGQVLENYLLRFPNAVLSFLVLVAAGLHAVLRRHRLLSGHLMLVDAVFLLATFVPCVLLFHRLPWFSFSGYPMAVPFLSLFILTRAVLVPSGPWTTLAISAPAPLLVLWSQWQAGATFARPQEAYSTSHYVDMLVQNQVVLWASVLVASIASRVNLGLRRQSYDARRIGQYRIHEHLGRGAMGEVMRATHALLKRPTAIKMLRPELTGETSLRRFEHEVQQTSRLRHPNTVTVYDYGHTADGVFYYAMELLHGAHVRRVVELDGPMVAGRVIHVLERACSALAEAHGLGLVHRDVKPENLMLCEQGGEVDVVKLLDFGLVRELGARDGHEIAGTPETMAPEVASGEEPTPAADLYSLAVVGWVLLSGRRLFDGENLTTVLQQHVERPPRWEDLPDDVPEDLRAILERALAKDPRDRPPDATLMREALLRCRDAGSWTPLDAQRWWSLHRERIVEAPRDEVDDRLAATTVLPGGERSP